MIKNQLQRLLKVTLFPRQTNGIFSGRELMGGTAGQVSDSQKDRA